jgi:hypothetical protein
VAEQLVDALIGFVSDEVDPLLRMSPKLRDHSPELAPIEGFPGRLRAGERGSWRSERAKLRRRRLRPPGAVRPLAGQSHARAGRSRPRGSSRRWPARRTRRCHWWSSRSTTAGRRSRAPRVATGRARGGRTAGRRGVRAARAEARRAQAPSGFATRRRGGRVRQKPRSSSSPRRVMAMRSSA